MATVNIPLDFPIWKEGSTERWLHTLIRHIILTLTGELTHYLFIMATYCGWAVLEIK